MVRDVHGEAAGAAYEGYVGNRGNFTDPGDRGRAERLDRPHSVYLQTLTRQWATAPAEIGANALSIAAVVRTTPKTREIRFLHTRETYEEKGHASACVTAMKDDTPAGHSLATHYAACNTRLSALFYLSLGFRADIASCSADMPQPGSLTPGGSSQMTFMWTRPREEDEAAACVEHLAFVKYVRAKQATRRSDSATDFVAGLDRVVAKLERNLGSAHRLAVRTPPATPPSRGPSRGSKRSRT